MTTYWLCTNQASFLKMLLDRHSKIHQPVPFPTKQHSFYTFVHFAPRSDSPPCCQVFMQILHRQSLEHLNQPRGLSLVSPSTFSLFCLLLFVLNRFLIMTQKTKPERVETLQETRAPPHLPHLWQ